MNTYQITATREDGTTFTDRVTAATPGEARKDFKDIYRHGKPYTITDTELLADDVPATKDQERKALEQIKAILATLGPNSYVATALDGCLEDAERNIEDDAAYSMKSRLESAEREIADLKDKLAESEKDYEAAHAAGHFIEEQKTKEIDAMKAQLEALAIDPTTTAGFAAILVEFSEAYIDDVRAVILANAEEWRQDKTAAALFTAWGEAVGNARRDMKYAAASFATEKDGLNEIKLAELLERYEDTHKALMAYNMGPSGASKLWEVGTYQSAYSREIMERAEYWAGVLEG